MTSNREPIPSSITFATVLTAEGRGAITVVRIWGAMALAVADAAFRPFRGAALSATGPGRLRVGRLGQGLGDEVVVFVTTDDPPEVEFQCHGGSAAVDLVLDALRKAGATIVDRSNRVRARAVSHLEAEAAFDLSWAPTLRAAEILQDQADGALRREIDDVLESLIREPVRALSRLDTLVTRGDFGVRMISGWRVVLAGRPNVGKSCLLNAMAGYQRAIVDAAPGTTRDVVTVRTAIGGWAVELLDTAGLRESDDPIEQAGVERAKTTHAKADLVLVLLDRSVPLTLDDEEILGVYPDSIRVATKVDLAPAWDSAQWRALPVSAKDGRGLDQLLTSICDRLVPEALPNDSPIPFRLRHVRLLRCARRFLKSGRPEMARKALERIVKPSRSPSSDSFKTIRTR